jgi:hypothetical protein
VTAVQFLFPENRLAKLIWRPAGVSYREAMEAAGANLEAMRDELLASLDANLARIEEIWTDATLAQNQPLQSEMYERSNFIAGLAGHCGLTELGQAAFSLCELLDRFITGARWSQRAIMVHMDALKLLRTLDVDASEAVRAAVVEGLRQVAERVIRPAGPDQAGAQSTKAE